MNRIGWLVGGAAAAVAFMLACEMGSDLGPGGAASADETTGRVVAITADTDPAQHVGGVVRDDGTTILAEGPLFLTEVIPQCSEENLGGPTLEFRKAEGAAACPQSSFRHFLSGKAQLIGVRLFVPAGCAVQLLSFDDCGVTWAGFRPYE
jgi:hypothetical protein